MNKHATVWFSSNWNDSSATKKVNLGTHRVNDEGDSEALALSGDGRVVAGWASSSISGEWHATLWYGPGWASKLDLGSLRNEETDRSEARAITPAATVVAGQSDSDNGSRAALWKVTYNSPLEPIVGDAPPVPPQPPQPKPKPPTVVVIDPVHTQQAMARMGDDAWSALSLQQQKLQRMQVGCVPQAGQACVGLSQNFAGRGGDTDATVGLDVAYGFGGNFSAGLALDHSLQRDLPGTHKDRRNNAGVGVFAHWQQNSDGNGWFIHPAAAFERYKLQLRRPTDLPNTEAGEGQSQVQGTAYSLTTRQNFTRGGGRQFGWYAAVRHSDLRRDGYTESNDVAFPVSYGDLRLHETSTAVGARAAIPLGSQLLWRASAEVEQHVAGSSPMYTAGARYVGGHSRELEVKKTRASVSTGLSYRLGPLFSVSLDAQSGNGMFGKTQWGTSLKLTGQF